MEASREQNHTEMRENFRHKIDFAEGLKSRRDIYLSSFNRDFGRGISNYFGVVAICVCHFKQTKQMLHKFSRSFLFAQYKKFISTKILFFFSFSRDESKNIRV